METFWKCLNCAEEVDDSFEICWKCNSDRNGSGATFEKIKLENEALSMKVDYNNTYKPLFLNENVQIDANAIIEAGKRLKKVVYIVIISTLFDLITIVYSVIQGDVRKMGGILLFCSLITILAWIVILIQLFYAGDSLEKSIHKKKKEMF